MCRVARARCGRVESVAGRLTAGGLAISIFPVPRSFGRDGRAGVRPDARHERCWTSSSFIGCLLVSAALCWRLRLRRESESTTAGAVADLPSSHTRHWQLAQRPARRLGAGEVAGAEPVLPASARLSPLASGLIALPRDRRSVARSARSEADRSRRAQDIPRGKLRARGRQRVGAVSFPGNDALSRLGRGAARLGFASTNVVFGSTVAASTGV